MEESNGTYTNFENLSNGERIARIAVSAAAIVVAMSSSIAGTSMFAVVSLIGITLAMTGVVGWDPVRALSAKSKNKTQAALHTSHSTYSNEHHA